MLEPLAEAPPEALGAPLEEPEAQLLGESEQDPEWLVLWLLEALGDAAAEILPLTVPDAEKQPDGEKLLVPQVVGEPVGQPLPLSNTDRDPEKLPLPLPLTLGIVDAEKLALPDHDVEEHPEVVKLFVIDAVIEKQELLEGLPDALLEPLPLPLAEAHMEPLRSKLVLALVVLVNKRDEEGEELLVAEGAPLTLTLGEEQAVLDMLALAEPEAESTKPLGEGCAEADEEGDFDAEGEAVLLPQRVTESDADGETEGAALLEPEREPLLLPESLGEPLLDPDTEAQPLPEAEALGVGDASGESDPLLLELPQWEGEALREVLPECDGVSVREARTEPVRGAEAEEDGDGAREPVKRGDAEAERQAVGEPRDEAEVLPLREGVFEVETETLRPSEGLPVLLPLLLGEPLSE